MMPICQSNPPFETSHRLCETGCRLIDDGMTSSEMKTPALGLHTQTNCVTTLLPVDFQNGTKPYCIKSLWTNLCWRRLAILLLPLSTSNIVKHPCSGTSSSCFVKVARFKRHTFCLNSNTVRSFHVCTVGENMPLKRLDSAIDHNNHLVILLKNYFSTAIAIPLLSSLWEERLILNCSRMFHA